MLPGRRCGGDGAPAGPRTAGECGTITQVPPPPLPDVPDPDATEVCPGCGAVLAPVADEVAAHPGASPSCARLFEVTLRGLREEASTDLASAATTRLADAAYDAQHPVPGRPEGVPTALERLAAGLGTRTGRRARHPAGWTTTIADVAADLDVIDLGVLVDSWARAVLGDWTAAADEPGTRYGSHQ